MLLNKLINNNDLKNLRTGCLIIKICRIPNVLRLITPRDQTSYLNHFRGPKRSSTQFHDWVETAETKLPFTLVLVIPSELNNWQLAQ